MAPSHVLHAHFPHPRNDLFPTARINQGYSAIHLSAASSCPRIFRPFPPALCSYTIVFSYSSITNHRSPCHLPSFPFSSVSSLFDRYQRIFYDLHFYRTLALILSYPSGFLLPHAVYYVSTFFSPFYPISYRCRQRRTMQRRLVIFCSSRRLCVFPSNTSLQRSFPCLIIC